MIKMILFYIRQPNKYNKLIKKKIDCQILIIFFNFIVYSNISIENIYNIFFSLIFIKIFLTNQIFYPIHIIVLKINIMIIFLYNNLM